MLTNVHTRSEGEDIKPGINLMAPDRFTEYQLTYRSSTTSFYFRIRPDWMVNDQNINKKYIFNWGL